MGLERRTGVNTRKGQRGKGEGNYPGGSSLLLRNAPGVRGPVGGR